MGEIRYVTESVPSPTEAREIAPGIWWHRKPLPFALDHINLWLLDDGDGWTLVDTGLNRSEVREAWEHIFAAVLGGKPVTRLIVTHFHPDHMGLAGWLAPRFDVPLWATLGEWALGRMLSLDDGRFSMDVFRSFYRRAGCNDEQMALVEERGNPYPTRVAPIPGSYRRLRDGQSIVIGGRSWKVITGTGHSPEHACLFCEAERILISGDQILPRISPNVSVWPQEPDGDPLALFLASLKRFEPLPADTLVLPSHDRPFVGLPGRIESLAHHHDERLEETWAACAEPASAVTVLRKLFKRSLDTHQFFFAIGETLAHLHHLAGLGRIARRPGAKGVDLFHQV